MATSPTSASLGGTPQAAEFGAAMRDMRHAHNADLVTVASNLRIRQAYLQAIEDGRFDDLPGPTYASGFVRAYAEYLGLDVGEVMRRYRDVTRGGGAQAPLVAPSPVSEGRMPTGFVLLVAAVLAAIAYGSWYYLTLHDRDAGEIVASLPQRIADIVGLSTSSGESVASPPRAVAPAAPPTPQTMKPPASPAPVIKTPAKKPAAVTERRKPAMPVAPAPAKPATPPTPPAARNEVPKPAATTPPASVEPAQGNVVSEPPAPANETAAPSATAAEATPTDGGQATAAPATPTEPTSSVSESPAPAETPSPVPGPDNTTAVASAPPAPAAPTVTTPSARPGRVVLRATAISWVELRDAQGNRVFSRLLKKGETYNVPPQKGITLATGNAGAIDIVVDGQTVAPIGPVGAVRRDVLLDPDALLARGAAGN